LLSRLQLDKTQFLNPETDHEKQTAIPPRVRHGPCLIRATRSVRCHKEIACTSRQAKQLARGQPIAGRESYAIPYSFRSDDAGHLLSWNDLGGRSKGEDLYHRGKAKIARV
jgi:hypothetical protein